MKPRRVLSLCSFLTLLFFCKPTECLVLGEVLDVISIGKDVVLSLAKAWKIVNEQVDTDAILPWKNPEKRLFEKIDLVQTELNKLDAEIAALGTGTINSILRYLPERIRYELRLHSLLDYITRIDVFYQNMNHYTNHSEIERVTLEDFAYSVTSHRSNSVRSLLERIHAFIAPASEDSGILKWAVVQEFPHDLTYGLNALDGVYVWAKTYSELRGVYALYESFRRFENLQTTPGRLPSPEQAWIDLTQTILQNGKSSIEQAQKTVIDFIVNENLYDEVLKEAEGDMVCNTNQSPQQMLYTIYNAVELTELKGYMMMQFSYMLLKLYDKGNFSKEAEIMKYRYKDRTLKSIESVKRAMERSSRDLWKCDPKQHVSGETYVEVTQLLQGYVQNEVDLNPKGTCRETCSEYSYTKSHGCFKNLYCKQQRKCNGKIINCKFVDSDMWVCPADVNTGRRYEYIEYENGRVLGRKQGCQKGTVKVDSWWRWLFWHCSYCFCLCDEQGSYSDRYVNMRSVIADVENNRVVTGLRFVKFNRIIHLQIQEGKLLPQGKIDLNTVRWVPVEDYKITTRYIYNGQDYHTFSWEERSVDLDDLTTDEGHVLTGVRFKKIGTHLNFEIYTSPFDFNTGKLIEPIHKSVWKDNSNTDVSLKNPRTQLHLRNPDVPTRLPTPSKPDSKSDQYLEMTHTDIDRDAAQTTVPFFDAQSVVPFVPVPLAGAGIYHKGGKNSGGFIAPKIITYDFSKHLNADFPQDNVEIN